MAVARRFKCSFHNHEFRSPEERPGCPFGCDPFTVQPLDAPKPEWPARCDDDEQGEDGRPTPPRGFDNADSALSVRQVETAEERARLAALRAALDRYRRDERRRACAEEALELRKEVACALKCAPAGLHKPLCRSLGFAPGCPLGAALSFSRGVAWAFPSQCQRLRARLDELYSHGGLEVELRATGRPRKDGTTGTRIRRIRFVRPTP
jgi:hypothetical protein